ncbi:hypothetical protein WH47_05053 [Habropoda laboriosa]|uniref:Uncharacterized protein n=1 Tax=Habropoda laboriosa TaxID=597456 RepID=A0A0L7QSC7_9HYME|nr:hypothetical protein WH47_05053 [Habropoda laboriosa]
MLSSGKRTETFRRIKDARWSTKDKLEQYRGILKLHAREKKIRSQDAAKSKRRITWKLGSYERDVKRYLQIVNETARGIPNARIRALLQNHADLRLKCRGRETEHVYAFVYDENHRKRCQLDNLRYEKKRKLKRCFELQDAIHRETLLNALKDDRRSQCEVIVRTTIMGQLVAEQTDDIGSKYKRVTRIVWNNMKERERMLTFVRGQVEDLWSYARSLIRTESDAILTTEITRTGTPPPNEALEKQIRSLEEIFDKIKDSLLVRSYQELLLRLEEQTKQRTRLLEQFDRNVKERDLSLSKKNDALTTLSNLEHSLVADSAPQNILLEQIAMQKNRESERKNSKKERGELLTDIRAALQNMVVMLICVRRGNKVVTKKSIDEERMDVPIIEKLETEGLALLSTVGRKVGALFGMSNFEFDKDREERAKDLYQTYVSNYRSKLKFDDTGLEPTGLVVEHRAIDSSVPTRAEIKLRSKQAVEAYTRLE